MPGKFHDALVVGTGFGGLYQIILLKQLGLDVKAIDSAGDVGGTVCRKICIHVYMLKF